MDKVLEGRAAPYKLLTTGRQAEGVGVEGRSVGEQEADWQWHHRLPSQQEGGARH